MHVVEIFMKSGNSFKVKVKELKAGPNTLQWVSDINQKRDRLIRVDYEQVEAIVQRK